jgi:hypothetical protein
VRYNAVSASSAVHHFFGDVANDASRILDANRNSHATGRGQSHQQRGAKTPKTDRLLSSSDRRHLLHFWLRHHGDGFSGNKAVQGSASLVFLAIGPRRQYCASSPIPEAAGSIIERMLHKLWLRSSRHTGPLPRVWCRCKIEGRPNQESGNFKLTTIASVTDCTITTSICLSRQPASTRATGAPRRCGEGTSAHVASLSCSSLGVLGVQSLKFFFHSLPKLRGTAWSRRLNFRA